MKFLQITIIIFSIFTSISLVAQVAINTNGNDPDASAILDIQSTSKGLLIPRVSTSEKDAILNPAEGLMVYDSTTSSFWYYSNSVWNRVGAAAGALNIEELEDGLSDTSFLFLGMGAGTPETYAHFNTGIGPDALGSIGFGIYNTAIGYETLKNLTNGSYNTAVGSEALHNNNSSFNTSVGTHSLRSSTSGSENTALGYQSMAYVSTGSRNTVIGSNANLFNSLGNENVILGANAGSNSSSSGSIFIGYTAGQNEFLDNKLYIENSNSATPLIGGDFSTDLVELNGDVEISGTIKIEGGIPGANKILTSDANGNASWENNNAATELNELTDAVYDGSSIYIGNGAGENDDGNNYNTSVGSNSLLFNTSGYGNTAIGYNSMLSNTSGPDNTSIGASALRHNTTGASNLAVGNYSLYENINGFQNLAMGYYSLFENTTGSSNTAIGHYAGKENIDGSGNTLFGKSSNYYNQNGTNNTIIGYEAGKGNALHNKNGNIFIGYQAGINETGDNKLYIENSNSSTPLIGGDFSLDEIYINGTLKIAGGNPGANKILTSDADGNASWENNSAASEINELSDAIYDGSSLFIGSQSGISDDGSNQNIGIGKYALQNNTSGFMNTSSGVYSLQTNTTGSNNTAFGNSTLKLNSSGSYNTAYGSQALYNNTGDENTASGYKALYSNTNGDYNTASGAYSSESMVNGFYNTSFGYESLNSATSSDYNTALGARALKSSTGSRNTAIGYFSLYQNTTGDYNTALGYRTGYGNTAGTYNTFIGYNATASGNSHSNSTAIGNEAQITASNQVRIGNASVTSIGGYANWSNLSDGRFKLNVDENVAGLDFILKLRPVNYTIDIDKLNTFLGSESKIKSNNEDLRRTGFIAQEVETAAHELNYEFSGVDTPENDNDHYSLRYAEFVVPLVKAVQELSIQNEQQAKLIEELQNRIDLLEKN